MTVSGRPRGRNSRARLARVLFYGVLSLLLLFLGVFQAFNIPEMPASEEEDASSSEDEDQTLDEAVDIAQAQAAAIALAEREAQSLRQQQVARARTQKEKVSYPSVMNREKNQHLGFATYLEKASDHWNGAPGSGRSFKKTLLQSLLDQAYDPDGMLSEQDQAACVMYLRQVFASATWFDKAMGNFCVCENIETATDLTPRQILDAIDIHYPKASSTATVNQEAVKAFQAQHKLLYELSANEGAVRAMAKSQGNIRQFSEDIGAMLFAYQTDRREAGDRFGPYKGSVVDPKQMMGMVTANLSLAEMLRTEYSARDSHIDAIKAAVQFKDFRAALLVIENNWNQVCPDASKRNATAARIMRMADPTGHGQTKRETKRSGPFENRPKRSWKGATADNPKISADTCAFWITDHADIQCVARDCKYVHDASVQNSVPAKQVIADCPWRSVTEVIRRRVSKLEEREKSLRAFPTDKSSKEKEPNVTAPGCLCGACKVPKSQLLTQSSFNEGKKCPLRKIHSRIRQRTDGAAVLQLLSSGEVTPSDIMHAKKDGILGNRGYNPTARVDRERQQRDQRDQRDREERASQQNRSDQRHDRNVRFRSPEPEHDRKRAKTYSLQQQRGAPRDRLEEVNRTPYEGAFGSHRALGVLLLMHCLLVATPHMNETAHHDLINKNVLHSFGEPYEQEAAGADTAVGGPASTLGITIASVLALVLTQLYVSTVNVAQNQPRRHSFSPSTRRTYHRRLLMPGGGRFKSSTGSLRNRKLYWHEFGGFGELLSVKVDNGDKNFKVELYRVGKRTSFQARLQHLKKRRRISAMQPADQTAAWLCMDSGASTHVTSNMAAYVSFHPFKGEARFVEDAGGTEHVIQGTGDIRWQTTDIDGEAVSVVIKGVDYCPTIVNGTFINTTDLRARQGWKCDGDVHGMFWTDSRGHRIKLKVRHGNEYMSGQPLIANSGAERVAGFVKSTFIRQLNAMSIRDVQDLVELKADTLTKWELHEASMRLAKSGVFTINTDTSKLLEIHHLLGHPSFRVVAAYCRKHKIPLGSVEKAFCTACLKARARKANRVRSENANKPKRRPLPLESFSADVFGPVETSKVGKERYVLIYADRGSNTIYSYPLKHLRDIPAQTRAWIHEVRRDLEAAGVKSFGVDLGATVLKTDSASYFKSKEMEKVLQDERIYIKFSPPEAQHRNGFAERTIQDCRNRAAALLKASGMAECYWNLAWDYAVLARDYMPRAANPKALSPHEMRTGEVVELSTFLHPFGSRVMAWRPKNDRHGKFDDAAREGIYVGWDRQTECHRVLLTTVSGREVVRSALHVTIDPNLPPGVYDPTLNESAPLYEEVEEEEFDRPWEEIAQDMANNATPGPDEDPGEAPEYVSNNYDFDELELDDDQVVQAQDFEQPGQDDAELDQEYQDASPDDSDMDDPIRDAYVGEDATLQPNEVAINADGTYRWNAIMSDRPHRKKTYVNRLAMILEGHRIEYSLKQAQKRFPTYAGLFPGAVQIEVQGLVGKCLKQTTWDSIQPNERVSTLLAIYTVKFEQGVFEKCKVRTVYRGEAEQYGVDWIVKSTNLPMLSTLRIFLALSPMENEIAGRMDVPQAFLLAPVQKVPGKGRVLVRFPNDITPRDSTNRPQLYEVTHSLYGMVSAAYQWEQKLFGFFRRIGLTQCKRDKAIWFSEGIMVLAWVDDTPYRATPEKAAWFKDKMYAEFGNCKDKPLDWCLGLAVVKDPETGYLGVHQSAYMDFMVERFGLQDASPANTPLPPDMKINKGDRCTDTRLSDSLKNEFQQLLGCICYVACWTQPQLAYAASALGAVASAPGPNHLKYARQVIRYCKGHRHLGLKYGPPQKVIDPETAYETGREGLDTTHDVDKLIIHSDASFAQEAKYCSQSSFVVMMNGAPVHWSSVRQAFPALSSSESEIMAGCHALRTALHMHAVMEDLGKPQGTIDFCFDARNALRFNESDKISKRNMHIGVRYWRVRYHAGKEIRLVYVKTTKMTADIGTKSTKADQFEGIVQMIMHNFDDGIKVLDISDHHGGK